MTGLSLLASILQGLGIGLLCVSSFWLGYRLGHQDGQQEMHWAHFDKGCYLDGNGEVYEHLRGES